MLAGTLNRKQIRQEPGEIARHIPMIDHQQDYHLVQRIAVKDESALQELYSVYGQRMFAYALRLTDEQPLAEDVVQDALVIIWHSAKGFRGDGRLVAWLLGIVHHTAIKALRHRTTQITDEMEKNLRVNEPSPEETVQINERSVNIRQGLQNLSPEHRAVLELVFYQGLSLNEIAEVCNCPLGTVKSRLSYARSHLRGLLTATEDF